MVLAVVEQLRGGQVHGDGNILARGVADALQGLHDELEGLFVRFDRRGVASLVADRRGPASFTNDLAEFVEGLGGPARRLGKRRRPDRHDHVLLEIRRTDRMLAPVEDVDQRDRHGIRIVGGFAKDVAHVLVELAAARDGPGPQTGDGNGQDGVGAQVGLVLGAVKLQHLLVDAALVGHLVADQGRRDDAVDIADRFEHAFALIALLLVVSQLDGFVLARRGPGRDHGRDSGEAIEIHGGFDGWIAARVQQLLGCDLEDVHPDIPLNSVGITCRLILLYKSGDSIRDSPAFG